MRRSILTTLTLVLALHAGAAAAQMAAPAAETAYGALSPGNQRMARALYEAQLSSPDVSSHRLTLEQIAAQKQRDTDWLDVFRSMREKGLIEETTLAAVITNYKNRHRISTSGTLTTGSNRVESVRGRHVPLPGDPD
jgi:hypothetical protein